MLHFQLGLSGKCCCGVSNRRKLAFRFLHALDYSDLLWQKKLRNAPAPPRATWKCNMCFVARSLRVRWGRDEKFSAIIGKGTERKWGCDRIVSRKAAIFVSAPRCNYKDERQICLTEFICKRMTFSQKDRPVCQEENVWAEQRGTESVAASWRKRGKK